MKSKLFYSLLFLTILFFGSASAQQTVKMTPSGIGYLQYLPQGYSGNTNKYPVVISLHGIKEKGNTSADVMKVANVGLPKYVKYGQQYPFILISPQLKTTMGRWTGDYVMQVVNYVKTYLRVDASRIYLTGLSLGGGGVISVSTAYPNVWAAVLPICMGYNITSAACNLAEVNVPAWGFHGDNDSVVGEQVTINMINAINNCSPRCTPQAKVTIFPGLGHVIWDKVYKETSALNWMLSYKKGTTSNDSSTPMNALPVANAGSDKSITLPTNAITIYGSANDSDGSIASYTWSKKSGGAATLSGTSTKDLKASGLVAGTYVFSLSVKDNDGAVDSDDVTVVVKSSTTTTNTAPIAYAGPNKTILLPTTSTTISGSGKDAENNIASYTWTKVNGTSVSMSGTSSKTLSLSGLKAGKYVFRLTVKDTKGAVDTDDMLLVVGQAPTVNAGSDRTITLPISSLNLTASVTDDGTVGVTWSKYSGPSLKLTNATSKTVTLSGFYEGTYVIKVVARDNQGFTDTDYVKIVVKSSVATIESITDSGIELASL